MTFGTIGRVADEFEGRRKRTDIAHDRILVPARPRAARCSDGVDEFGTASVE